MGSFRLSQALKIKGPTSLSNASLAELSLVPDEVSHILRLMMLSWRDK
ncbi:hypothetical protein COLO4_22778 [Corchorus olitorius]|uniref:Uncharacterized protein n=1 Tax=Corchorus olitorius TaxID=93759 RepID=A0A1R3IJX4_9ROSI|nr:hypothetical protein COLO4_22778 [Corchorus olitorius]